MTSEQYTFAAQDQKFSVTVVRKKVKNINLHIRNDGNLFISASPRVPWAYIEAFLQKKSDLICRAVQKLQEQQKKFPFLTLSDGETLLITGKPYRLDVRLGLRNTIRRNQDTVFMELKDDTPQTRRTTEVLNCIFEVVCRRHRSGGIVHRWRGPCHFQASG